MSSFAQKFVRNEHGATSIEYALIASLMCLVIVAAVTSVGTEVGAIFDSIATAYQETR